MEDTFKCFKCFLVSVTADETPVGFQANSIQEALKIATKKVGSRKWQLRFQMANTDADVTDGLIALYRAKPYYLYIHEYHAE